MAKFCHNCGVPLEGTPKFCPSCGAPMAEVSAPPQAQQKPMTQEQPKPIAPQNAQPMMPPLQQQPSTAQRPQRRVQMPPRPQQMSPRPPMQGQPGPGGAPMPMTGGMPLQGQPPMQGQGPQSPQGMQNPMMQQQMPPQGMQNPPMQGMPPQMQNPPMQRQTPQPPMMQGQPMMYQNAPGQSYSQQPYGGWQGQGAPNAYAQQPAGVFTLGPLGTDVGLVQMFLRYDGRLNRKPYIFRGLALFGVVFVISLIFAILGTTMNSSTISMLGSVVSIIAAVPGVMLMIRRLHDLDRPTWWVVGGFIPVVNVALGFYLLLARGTYGPNQYGPDPLEGQQ